MNENIRRALDDLVGQPPITLGRRGAVMRRIEKVHARRKMAMQATLSVVMVMGLAFGATRVINATPTGTDVLMQEEKPTAEPEKKAVPVESPKAKAKPKPEVKKESPKPVAEEPKAEPTYTKPKPEPTYTKPKPDPTYTKSPVGGLSVELWPYTDAYAGQSMDWKVKAYDPAGRLLRIELLYGDGTKSVYEPEMPCGEGTSVKKFFSHTYAKAATYTAKATVTTGGCGAETETKVVSNYVKVHAAGAGNGPSQPTVSAEQVAAAIATLNLHGADADGWVKKFYIEWGDGTETYAGPRPFDGCQDGKPSSWDTTATHEYAGPGTYTVKVTVLSTNCDAGQGQTKTVSLTVTV